MEFILRNLVKVFGLNKLAIMVWGLVYPELEKLAKKTETSFDNEALKLVDTILRGMLGQSVALGYLGPQDLGAVAGISAVGSQAPRGERNAAPSKSKKKNASKAVA